MRRLCERDIRARPGADRKAPVTCRTPASHAPIRCARPGGASQIEMQELAVGARPIIRERLSVDESPLAIEHQRRLECGTDARFQAQAAAASRASFPDDVLEEG